MDPEGRGRRERLSATRARVQSVPLWVFGVFVATAGPLVVLRLGSYHWFLRDEWSFLADRGSIGPSDLLEPNGGSHWVALPRLIYAVLWHLVGLTTYRPYQICVVAMHLSVAILLRALMRRVGVSPWLATAAASMIVLFGPGAQNIVWAFQVGFTGSIAFGLAHLLLAHHDGPVDRRDLIGLGFGLLAITSSGVGVTTTVAVTTSVLMRRGWRPALLHGLPLAAVYATWALVSGANATSPYGRPTLDALLAWVRSSGVGTLLALAHFRFVAYLFAVLLAVGTALAWQHRPNRDWRELRTQLSIPVGLAAAGLFFAVTTGLGRWWLGDGESGARSSRYLYLEAVLLLPILALSAETITRRWRLAGPALVALFLAPIPFNLDGFDGGVFNEQYMDNRRYILTTAIRMPFAGDVPRDVQPAPDPYSSGAVTIGFLLTAEESGHLRASTTPLTPEVVNEFKVRLGVAQRQDPRPVPSCPGSSEPVDLDPNQGDVLRLGSPVAISTRDDGDSSSRAVVFRPNLGGSKLTIELPDLHLRVRPAPGASTFRLCAQG